MVVKSCEPLFELLVHTNAFALRRQVHTHKSYAHTGALTARAARTRTCTGGPAKGGRGWGGGVTQGQAATSRMPLDEHGGCTPSTPGLAL